MATLSLQLVFMNEQGRSVMVTIPDPKPTLTSAEVEEAMQSIIAKGVFTSPGGALTTVSAARLISREVTPLI